MSEYPTSLSDAWVDACIRLWSLCENSGRDTSNITIWDGFRFLYLKKVPQDLRGRKSKGVIDDVTY